VSPRQPNQQAIAVYLAKTSVKHFYQVHPTLAKVNTGGILRCPIFFCVASVKVKTSGPRATVDLNAWLAWDVCFSLGGGFAASTFLVLPILTPQLNNAKSLPPAWAVVVSTDINKVSAILFTQFIGVILPS
jgi:hypothetical protein